MEGSILESIGAEIIGLVVPVSVCMFLVVLLVHSLTPHGAEVAIQSVATLVYTEKATDSNSTKFEGALLNSLVFVAIITIITFLLVLLYYYRCIRFLKWYMCASAALVLAFMGGTVFLQLIRTWSIPVDVVTFSLFLLNFTIVGVLSVFLKGLPILMTQFYLVMIGMLVAFWFTMLPEWTTWVLLVAMAVYDLIAVLAPGGPLNLLVELAMSRDEEIPALIYESRPISVSPPTGSIAPALASGDPSASASFTGTSTNRRARRWRRRNRSVSTVVSRRPAMELQPFHLSSGSENEVHRGDTVTGTGQFSRLRNEPHNDPIVQLLPIGSASNMENHTNGVSAQNSSSAYEEPEIADEESMPLVSHPSRSASIVATVDRNEFLEVQEVHPEVSEDDSEDAIGLSASGAIKLGLGDFVFYSVLVGRAAMYDLMTVYACYLAIIAGLGSTLILLAIARRALPALPISICLGVVFYFLTRLLMEPLVVLLSTNLIFF
eukprot:c27505_g1_i1 orf=147-1619(+)